MQVRLESQLIAPIWVSLQMFSSRLDDDNANALVDASCRRGRCGPVMPRLAAPGQGSRSRRGSRRSLAGSALSSTLSYCPSFVEFVGTFRASCILCIYTAKFAGKPCGQPLARLAPPPHVKSETAHRPMKCPDGQRLQLLLRGRQHRLEGQTHTDAARRNPWRTLARECSVLRASASGSRSGE